MMKNVANVLIHTQFQPGELSAFSRNSQGPGAVPEPGRPAYIGTRDQTCRSPGLLLSGPTSPIEIMVVTSCNCYNLPGMMHQVSMFGFRDFSYKGNQEVYLRTGGDLADLKKQLEG